VAVLDSQPLKQSVEELPSLTFITGFPPSSDAFQFDTAGLLFEGFDVYQNARALPELGTVTDPFGRRAEI
jgi:hypothetical protein